MRPRKTLIERFSAFIQFEADQFRTWLSDRRLRHSMEQQMAERELDDDYWTLHWHRAWQHKSDGIAQDHLVAYVQELTYWAATKTHSRFGQGAYGVADLFQMAIARFNRVLEGFDPQQGSSFKGYATVMMANLLRESLRQQRAIDICSDWGLLRKLSQKRLGAALAQVGLSAATVEQYLLAWRCFNAIYAPSQKDASRRLPKPDEATWQAITDLYNRDRLSDTSIPAASSDDLASWLAASAQAARQYLYPTTISIDAPTQTGSSEYSDSLTDADQSEGLARLVQIEEWHQRQTQRQQMTEVLQTGLETLDAESKELLRLYYQQQLTQQAIAKQLGVKQYTVSRRLTRIRETLLRALVEWGRNGLHISPTLDVINNTSIALDEWLMNYYSSISPKEA